MMMPGCEICNTQRPQGVTMQVTDEKCRTVTAFRRTKPAFLKSNAPSSSVLTKRNSPYRYDENVRRKRLKSITQMSSSRHKMRPFDSNNETEQPRRRTLSYFPSNSSTLEVSRSKLDSYFGEVNLDENPYNPKKLKISKNS